MLGGTLRDCGTEGVNCNIFLSPGLNNSSYVTDFDTSFKLTKNDIKILSHLTFALLFLINSFCTLQKPCLCNPY